MANDIVGVQPMSEPSGMIYSPYIPFRVSNSTGESYWYDEYLQRNHYSDEPIAKDYRDFTPMLEFYWNKFIREDIPRMVVYAPRQCGKTFFLKSLMRNNPEYQLGCMNHRDCYDKIRDLGSIEGIRSRVFNASNDNDMWYNRESGVYLFDEYCPHMRGIHNKRAFILITPNGNRSQLYSKNCVMTVDMLRDYPKDLEESKIIRCYLPEELFNVE
jgi:hypothetical protein